MNSEESDVYKKADLIKKNLLFGLLSAALSAIALPNSHAAEISFAGAIMDDKGSEISQWRTTGTKKSMDPDGDHQYGSDALLFYLVLGPKPGQYVSYVRSQQQIEPSPQYAMVDAPDGQNDINVRTTTSGLQPVDSLQDMFTFQIEAGVPSAFRVGIALDCLNGAQFTGADITLVQTAKGVASATSETPANNKIDMYFFDVKGAVVGEQYTVRAKVGSGRHATNSIVTWDTLPARSLIGTWDDAQGNRALVCKSDGTFNGAHGDGGTYKLDGSNLVLDYKQGGKVEGKVSFLDANSFMLGGLLFSRVVDRKDFSLVGTWVLTPPRIEQPGTYRIREFKEDGAFIYTDVTVVEKHTYKLTGLQLAITSDETGPTEEPVRITNANLITMDGDPYMRAIPYGHTERLLGTWKAKGKAGWTEFKKGGITFLNDGKATRTRTYKIGDNEQGKEMLDMYEAILGKDGAPTFEVQRYTDSITFVDGDTIKTRDHIWTRVTSP